jgi:hypothetical protein
MPVPPLPSSSRHRNVIELQDGNAPMPRIEGVKPGMEIIGADGVHVGTVDALDGSRIRLTKADSGIGSHAGHRHYVPGGLIAEVEGNRVRLSANGNVAVSFEEGI